MRNQTAQINNDGMINENVHNVSTLKTGVNDIINKHVILQTIPVYHDHGFNNITCIIK